MMGRAVQALARQGANGLIVLGGDHLQLGSRKTFVMNEEEIGFQEVSDAPVQSLKRRSSETALGILSASRRSCEEAWP